MPLLVVLLLAGQAAYQPFLDKHCFRCHGPDTKKAGLDLSRPLAPERWARVHDRIAAGEMPPGKKPDRAIVAKALKDLSDSIIAVEVKRRATEGRAAIRRLNRTEYENTLRDLLQLPGLNVKDLLPDDGRAHGFDKSADALDVSPVLLAKYAEAADVALSLAVAKWSVPPVPFKERMYAHRQYDFLVVIPNGDGVMVKDFKYDSSRFPIPKDKYAGGKYKGLAELDRSRDWREPGTAALFRTLGESFAGRFSQFSPVIPGRYRITFSTWSFWWDKGEIKPSPRMQAAGIYYGGRLLGHFDAPSMKPTQHEIEAWLEPGEYLKFDPASLWETHVYFQKGKAAGFRGPAVAIDWLEVEGPLYDEWPPPSHKRLFGDLPLVPLSRLAGDATPPRRTMPRQNTRDGRNTPGRLVFATVDPDKPVAWVERLLADFLPRAFRRPVGRRELARYAALAVKRLAAGDCFEDAMKAAYKTALCSPAFLFLEGTASRLSYFLWNSMPDEELLKADLTDPAELRKQTERLLKDEKAGRFVTDFAQQWLDQRDFTLTSPDRALYPEWQPYLAEAVQREPREYLKALIDVNHPASETVRSGFVTVNQRLAEHYGIKGVQGTRFRRVAVGGSHRGGFLTQAGILKVTANGTTTSPVKRGAWVMRKMLGRPPHPPPPDIPAIEPDVRGATTIREQLARHKASPACASCHKSMDPPGFALESFDPIGGFRTHYRSTGKGAVPDHAALFVSHLDPLGKFPSAIYHAGFRVGLPVDASGEADGKAFKGIDEFKKMLDEKQVARNLANQFVAYSTGAPVTFADRAAIERILEKAGPGHKLRSLIHEVVQSPLFLKK